MTRYVVITTVNIPSVPLQQGGSKLECPIHSVINAIVLDDPAQYSVSENTVLVQSDVLNIGDLYSGA